MAFYNVGPAQEQSVVTVLREIAEKQRRANLDAQARRRGDMQYALGVLNVARQMGMKPEEFSRVVDQLSGNLSPEALAFLESSAPALGRSADLAEAAFEAQKYELEKAKEVLDTRLKKLKADVKATQVGTDVSKAQKSYIEKQTAAIDTQLEQNGDYIRAKIANMERNAKTAEEQLKFAKAQAVVQSMLDVLKLRITAGYYEGLLNQAKYGRKGGKNQPSGYAEAMQDLTKILGDSMTTVLNTAKTLEALGVDISEKDTRQMVMNVLENMEPVAAQYGYTVKFGEGKNKGFWAKLTNELLKQAAPGVGLAAGSWEGVGSLMEMIGDQLELIPTGTPGRPSKEVGKGIKIGGETLKKAAKGARQALSLGIQATEEEPAGFFLSPMVNDPMAATRVSGNPAASGAFGIGTLLGNLPATQFLSTLPQKPGGSQSGSEPDQLEQVIQGLDLLLDQTTKR